MMYTTWQMNDENGVHTHNGFGLAVKKNENMKLSSKWMELENILNEVTQVQKGKCCMFSLICGS